MKKVYLCFLLSYFLFSIICAQKEEKIPITFGRVSVEDFSPEVYSLDSSADAIVIAELGSVEYNANGTLDLIQKVSRRIRILNKNGFSAADVSIDLLRGEIDDEQLISLKASTYLLENGKVVEYEVKKDAIFTNKLDKDHYEKKFTFPNVKEGAIIEYTYTKLTQDVTFIDRWNFREKYPKLWSEYNYEFPQFLDFRTFYKGDPVFNINSTNKYQKSFKFVNSKSAFSPDGSSVRVPVQIKRLVMKNIPALRDEPFVLSSKNYRSSIEFELAGINFENEVYKDVASTWSIIFNKLQNRDYFGAGLNADNKWMDIILNAKLKDLKTDIEKAHTIYTIVQNKMQFNGATTIYIDQKHKQAFESGNGSIADINLLLIAMLRHSGLRVEPVILSTSKNGRANAYFPLTREYNYVICKLMVNGQNYFLDASSKYRPFGKLPYGCYNGIGVTVDPSNPQSQLFLRDSIVEKKSTTIMMRLNTENKLEASITSILGDNESEAVRSTVIQKNSTDYSNKMKNKLGTDVKLTSCRFDSLKELESPLALKYIYTLPVENENIIYITPLIGEQYSINPFNATKRTLPIELPSRVLEVISFNLFIPSGYILEEKPESIKINLGDNSGYFEYIAASDESMIQIRSIIKLNKSTFSLEEYDLLREFYAQIIKKHTEQLVLKKIKN
jgi:hypothetical protein